MIRREMEIHRVTQLRVHSFENMCAIAPANYAALREDGHSVVFDGMAIVHDKWRDTCPVQADGHEDVFVAELDIEKLRVHRACETWGNTYRRSRAYSELVSTRVDSPFQRPDARR